ncbi:unnamed protein product [marine sediment metagenome]|uniref:Uncharacterized protein n=1 Tax=marine sediment metagenome TaxID=412755 RepID=X0V0M8_9ZZZZ
MFRWRGIGRVRAECAAFVDELIFPPDQSHQQINLGPEAGLFRRSGSYSLVRFFDEGSKACETFFTAVDKKIEQSGVHCSLHKVERGLTACDVQYEPSVL